MPGDSTRHREERREEGAERMGGERKGQREWEERRRGRENGRRGRKDKGDKECGRQKPACPARTGGRGSRAITR